MKQAGDAGLREVKCPVHKALLMGKTLVCVSTGLQLCGTLVSEGVQRSMVQHACEFGHAYSVLWLQSALESIVWVYASDSKDGYIWYSRRSSWPVVTS